MRELIERLERMEANRVALDILQEQLKEMEATTDGLRAQKLDSIKVSGSPDTESALAAALDKRAKLAAQIRTITTELSIMNKALQTLSADERIVLDLFYIHRRKDHVGELKLRLGYETSTIYRIKDAALQRLSERLHGPT